MFIVKGICLNQNCHNKNTIRPLIERQQGKCSYCRVPLDFPMPKRDDPPLLTRVRKQLVFPFVN